MSDAQLLASFSELAVRQGALDIGMDLLIRSFVQRTRTGLDRSFPQ
jgi:hypothetical protein